MLVLSRKVGERILIGDRVSVTIVKIGRGGVRIGVDAPPETRVMREELAEEIANDTPSFPSLISHIVEDQEGVVPDGDSLPFIERR